VSLKKGVGNGDYDFSRGAWDERVDSELSHEVDWSTTVSSSRRKGIWEYVTRVYANLSNGGVRQVVVLQEEWPNADNVSYSAWWYQHNHKVARMVESWALNKGYH